MAFRICRINVDARKADGTTIPDVQIPTEFYITGTVNGTYQRCSEVKGTFRMCRIYDKSVEPETAIVVVVVVVMYPEMGNQSKICISGITVWADTWR